MTDAGSVQVRFTVANAEVVRQALKDLGEQGQKSLKQFDSSAQPVSGSMKVLGEVVSSAKEKASELAGEGGAVASILMRWGPAGLIAGAALGGVILLLERMKERSDALAQTASGFSNFAAVVGLSTDQVQSLIIAGAKLGQDQQSVAGFVEKASIAWDQLRKGQGTALDEIRQINPALADQLERARDMSTALDVLAKAWANASDQAQRNTIARAFGGRGGVAAGNAVLGGIADAGGFRQLTDDAKAAGNAIDAGLIKKLDSLRVEIEETKKRTENIFATIFAEDVLDKELRFAVQMERAARAAKDLADQQKNMSWLERFFDNLVRGETGLVPGMQEAIDEANKRPRITIDAVRMPMPQTRPSPGQNLGDDNFGAKTAQATLADMQKWTSLLGNALTLEEQHKLKLVEIAAAQERGGVAGDKAARALAAFDLAQAASIAAERTRLGIESEEALLQQRLAELQDLRAKGFIKNDEEMRLAEQGVRKEVKDTIDAMSARGAILPGLKQMELDAGRLDKQLDTLSTSGLRSVNDELTNFETGASSGADAIKNLDKQFARSLANMLNQMIIIKPMAESLQSLLSNISGGGFNLSNLFSGRSGGEGGVDPAAESARGNVFDRGVIRPFRAGGIIDRYVQFRMANGGLASAGEGGRAEGIFPLKRMRNGELGVASERGGSPGTVVNVKVENNHSGADVSVGEPKRSPDGTVSLDILVDQLENAISGRIARGGSTANRAFEGRYGLAPVVGR